ncbi:hypothetical protein E3N94_04010 [Cryobacterium sp. Sr3]|nr:hypothetical protein E3N94_04010 [Cryobacterium sp. Sr3]
MIDRAALRAWLEATCALQGVPVAVTDIGVVSRVGVLLRGRDVAGLPRSGDRNARPSQLPAGKDPVVVHAPGS